MDSSGLLQVWPSHLPHFSPILTYPPAMLQDSAPPAGRFRPYASTKHRVTRGRYITSNDPRGYMSVCCPYLTDCVPGGARIIRRV